MFKGWVGESGRGGGECLGTGQSVQRLEVEKALPACRRALASVTGALSRGEGHLMEWKDHSYCWHFWGLAIFKDLLKAMHALSGNMLIHSWFRKIRDCQKPACELQSKKSCLRDRCHWNWLSEGEKVLAPGRVGNQQCLQDCRRPRVLTRQGFISLLPVPLNALDSQKSRWILGTRIFLCSCASWICLQC